MSTPVPPPPPARRSPFGESAPMPAPAGTGVPGSVPPPPPATPRPVEHKAPEPVQEPDPFEEELEDETAELLNEVAELEEHDEEFVTLTVEEPDNYTPPELIQPVKEPAVKENPVEETPVEDNQNIYARAAGAPQRPDAGQYHAPEQKEGIIFAPEVQQSAQALLDFIGDDECSEVLMNGPNEISRKVKGARFHCGEIMFGDASSYHDVINEVILPYCDTSDRIDGMNVLIEGQMELPSPSGRPPMLARVHIIAPPGVKYAKVTIAKKPRTDFTLDDMVSVGSLTREMAEFLKAIARGKATFVVAGPTGSGKTTMLQAMSHYFDPNDRIIVIEETPELRLPLGDVVYLRATLEKPGMSPSEVYTLAFWARQANRMRMDRIVVGETRGGEMAEWLIAANSGAEGSATTVHADSPRRTLDKILGLASSGRGSMGEDQLRKEIAATVDIVVQCSLIDGRHVITGIAEVVNTVTQQTGQILLSDIFTYDRAKQVHESRGRPSDGFITQLGNRGVPLNASWFRGVTPR